MVLDMVEDIQPRSKTNQNTKAEKQPRILPEERGHRGHPLSNGFHQPSVKRAASRPQRNNDQDKQVKVYPFSPCGKEE